mmetsp:Transcript_14199/g.24136  ORF Transcript_14199/g.24136 Transcript_14199/m.24136 type:complete len:164 (+) Transcript_14199:1239-1730(+)
MKLESNQSDSAKNIRKKRKMTAKLLGTMTQTKEHYQPNSYREHDDFMNQLLLTQNSQTERQKLARSFKSVISGTNSRKSSMRSGSLRSNEVKKNLRNKIGSYFDKFKGKNTAHHQESKKVQSKTVAISFNNLSQLGGEQSQHVDRSDSRDPRIKSLISQDALA